MSPQRYEGWSIVNIKLLLGLLEKKNIGIAILCVVEILLKLMSSCFGREMGRVCLRGRGRKLFAEAASSKYDRPSDTSVISFVRNLNVYHQIRTRKQLCNTKYAKKRTLTPPLMLEVRTDFRVWWVLPKKSLFRQFLCHEGKKMLHTGVRSILMPPTSHMLCSLNRHQG